MWRSEERRVGKECRSLCDWSSDVCSSDLFYAYLNALPAPRSSVRIAMLRIPGTASRPCEQQNVDGNNPIQVLFNKMFTSTARLPIISFSKRGHQEAHERHRRPPPGPGQRGAPDIFAAIGGTGLGAGGAGPERSVGLGGFGLDVIRSGGRRRPVR